MTPGYFKYRITRDLTNLSLVKRRGYDGYIVSMHQSGTHWLLHMLAEVIAEKYQLPMSTDLQKNTIVGSPKLLKDLPAGVPRIFHGHQIPNPLIANALMLRLLRMPNYVLLLRDPRVVLASHYKRFQHRYKIGFSDFLRTRIDVMHQSGGCRKFDKDIWWDIRFQNSWYAMQQARPEGVHLVKYEGLRANTLGELHQVAAYLGLREVDDKLLEMAIERSSKEGMAKKENPNRADKVVRLDTDNPLALYSPEDKDYFVATYQRYCKADFGYDLNAGW